MTAPSPRPALFIDRDGTLIEDVPYNSDPEKVRLFPGVKEALVRAKAAGFVIVLVTNQSGIGRGWLKEADYYKVHERFASLLGADLLDAAYMCPDAPDCPSERRKPAPGMVLEAIRDLHLDPARSWFIGDKPADVQCGLNAGVKAVQVMTGEGAAAPDPAATFHARDFSHAVEFILSMC